MALQLMHKIDWIEEINNNDSIYLHIDALFQRDVWHGVRFKTD